jgi:hypothetical protein
VDSEADLDWLALVSLLSNIINLRVHAINAACALIRIPSGGLGAFAPIIETRERKRPTEESGQHWERSELVARPPRQAEPRPPAGGGLSRGLSLMSHLKEHLFTICKQFVNNFNVVSVTYRLSL